MNASIIVTGIISILMSLLNHYLTGEASPNVATVALGGGGFLATIYGFIQNRFKNVNKLELLTDIQKAVADGKISLDEIISLAKVLGIDINNLDILKDKNNPSKTNLDKFKQRLDYVLNDPAIQENVESKGVPQEIKFTFSDSSEISEKITLTAVKS